MVKMELFDTVGESITVDSVKSFLNANKENDIQFNISSLGGDLATAITIHDLIKAHPKNTLANIVGLTASAGTVIAIACDEVQMSDNSLFLIHNGWKEMTGNVYDFQKAASDLMKTDAIMVKMYREKTGMADEKIKNIMKASDWLSPSEALELGFINRIIPSGNKIAASVFLSEAQGKINDQLLIKLQEKMNIFGKKKPETVCNLLALKEGNAVINAEIPAAGVEIAPLGAMTLEDGEYELADGRKIIVAGGVITEVKELAAPIESAVSSEEILNAVGAVVTDAVAKIKADFMAELAKIKSVHVPAKGNGAIDTGKAQMPVDVKSKVEGFAKAIKDKINESRKA